MGATYDSYGRQATRTIGGQTAATVTDTVTRSQSGRITENDTAGAVWDYGYDNAGRLDEASRAGVAYSYGYDNNSNRTALSVTGQTPVSYTYSSWDRLTSYTGAGNVSYDGRGNTTSIDGLTGS